MIKGKILLIDPAKIINEYAACGNHFDKLNPTMKQDEIYRRCKDEFVGRHMDSWLERIIENE